MDHIMLSDTLRAVILGIIEGVTEFLPVSSTGHLLLAQRFFGLGEGSFWQSFAVLIQLGAILAIVVIYFAKLWRIALGMFSDPDARRFVIGVLVAFLPAAVIRAAAGRYLKGHFFNPWGVGFPPIRGRAPPLGGRGGGGRGGGGNSGFCGGSGPGWARSLMIFKRTAPR